MARRSAGSAGRAVPTAGKASGRGTAIARHSDARTGRRPSSGQGVGSTACPFGEGTTRRPARQVSTLPWRPLGRQTGQETARPARRRTYGVGAAKSISTATQATSGTPAAGARPGRLTPAAPSRKGCGRRAKAPLSLASSYGISKGRTAAISLAAASGQASGTITQGAPATRPGSKGAFRLAAAFGRQVSKEGLVLRHSGRATITPALGFEIWHGVEGQAPIFATGEIGKRKAAAGS